MRLVKQCYVQLEVVERLATCRSKRLHYGSADDKSNAKSRADSTCLQTSNPPRVGSSSQFISGCTLLGYCRAPVIVRSARRRAALFWASLSRASRDRVRLIMPRPARNIRRLESSHITRTSLSVAPSFPRLRVSHCH